MGKLIVIIKGIFASDNSLKVGLSQFKQNNETSPEIVKKTTRKETKLSDLMRGQC